MDGRHYDNHTVYITSSGDNSSDDLVLATKQALHKAENTLSRKFPCTIHANAVQNRELRYLGFSYIWVSNVEVYNMLLGLEPDGRERYEFIEEENDDDFDMDFSMSEPRGWGDLVEEIEAKKVKVPLPSLMPLKLPHEAPNICLERAYVYDNRDEFKHNILISRGPKWLRAEDLRAALRHYTASKDPNYPKVDITVNDRDASICVRYDPSTYEAQFALLMIRKLTMYSKKKEEKTLFFAHPRAKSTA